MFLTFGNYHNLALRKYSMILCLNALAELASISEDFNIFQCFIIECFIMGIYVLQFIEVDVKRF